MAALGINTSRYSIMLVYSYTDTHECELANRIRLGKLFAYSVAKAEFSGRGMPCVSGCVPGPCTRCEARGT